MLPGGLGSPARQLTRKVIDIRAVSHVVGDTGAIYLARPAGAQYCAHQICADQECARTLEMFVSPPRTKDTPTQTGTAAQPAAETGAALLEWVWKKHSSNASSIKGYPRPKIA